LPLPSQHLGRFDPGLTPVSRGGIAFTGTTLNIEHRISNIEYPHAEGVPSEKGQSGIQYRVSSIQHPVSSIPKKRFS
jgi:hypothetical protein